MLSDEGVGGVWKRSHTFFCSIDVMADPRPIRDTERYQGCYEARQDIDDIDNFALSLLHRLKASNNIFVSSLTSTWIDDH